ncbi:MAG: alpha/beta hydrolase fold [Actinomycetia bacterium]|nr:alpha/beta hydrolase fold [Actinomycetes bacterium]
MRPAPRADNDSAIPTISANGIDLYYERRGAGPRLLFLNGSGSTLASSSLLVDPFAARFDVVAHDQRGLGNTEIPTGPYTMGDYAADAIALLDAVGWDRCRVVGVSFGGMVAQELAVTAPERVERLALCCTSPGGAGGASYPLHELASLPVAERAEIGTRLLDTRFDREWLASHPGDRGLAEMMAARRADADKNADELRGETEQLRARAGHDVCDRLRLVSAPTLIAGGRYDGIAPVANAEAIATRVPHAELRLYEGGHAFFAQDPKALPEILDFLADESS